MLLCWPAVYLVKAAMFSSANVHVWNCEHAIGNSVFHRCEAMELHSNLEALHCRVPSYTRKQIKKRYHKNIKEQLGIYLFQKSLRYPKTYSFRVGDWHFLLLVLQFLWLCAWKQCINSN